VTDLWAGVAGATSLLSAPVYGYVAWRLYRRPVPAEARLPAAQFSAWWLAFGVGAAITGVEGVLGAAGRLSLPLAMTAYVLSLLVDSVALWGLVAYLVYIYTGRSRVVLLSAFYATFYVAALFYTVARHPIGVTEPGGVPTLVYAYGSSGVIFAFVVVGLVVPELVGIILYASLLRRTTERTLRYRIALVTTGLVLFFVPAFFSPPGAWVSADVWTVVKAGLDVAGALVVLLAYFPPTAIRRRFRVGRVGVPLPGTDDPMPG
jgi:hypothetical protein